MRKDITLTSYLTSAILLGNRYTNVLEQGTEIMAQHHPTVQEDRLVYQLDGRTQQIMLDTSEWYAWLGVASMFTFRSAIGTFTARKEHAGNKRGGWYWKAYR
jgi:hypothetical protein